MYKKEIMPRLLEKNEYTLNGENWKLCVGVSADGAFLVEGNFGGFEILNSELFRIVLKDGGGEVSEICSSCGWTEIFGQTSENIIELVFGKHSSVSDLSVALRGEFDIKGISWYLDIDNSSEKYTVSSAFYTTPELRSKIINLFAPDRSGRVFYNIGEEGYSKSDTYPGFHLSMQYYAFWGETGGIYMGVHDPAGGLKKFTVKAEEGKARLLAEYPAVGAGNFGNAFSLGGYMRWETFKGDWYDATLIYRDFVYKYASWLPEKGRPDTADKYKKIGFWANYFGNQDSFDAILSLKQEINVPMATHAYGWHSNKFDTDYPHFMPPREICVDAFRKMREVGVYVMPYINGVSWDTMDCESGYEINYRDLGVRGVAVRPDGTLTEIAYGNLRPSGEKVKLATMCPSFAPWRDIMYKLVKQMEKELPIDGVYFDQVAAISPIACSSKEHGHLPGGGSYWAEAFNVMMKKIRENRPSESFYFTECNSEPYLRSFDGVLTCEWNVNGLVPAFPLIYTGYIQMLGRNTDSNGKPEDDEYFCYHFAQSVLFGQQPGWFYSRRGLAPKKLDFMKKCVAVRMADLDIFNEGCILRSPVVRSDRADIESQRGSLAPVMAQVWRSKDGSGVKLFAANIADETVRSTIEIYPAEYGVECPESIETELLPKSVTVITLK